MPDLSALVPGHALLAAGLSIRMSSIRIVKHPKYDAAQLDVIVHITMSFPRNVALVVAVSLAFERGRLFERI